MFIVRRRAGPAKKPACRQAGGGALALRVEAFFCLDLFGSFCVKAKRTEKYLQYIQGSHKLTRTEPRVVGEKYHQQQKFYEVEKVIELNILFSQTSIYPPNIRPISDVCFL